jgi:hypothetical protein
MKNTNAKDTKILEPPFGPLGQRLSFFSTIVSNVVKHNIVVSIDLLVRVGLLEGGKCIVSASGTDANGLLTSDMASQFLLFCGGLFFLENMSMCCLSSASV